MVRLFAYLLLFSCLVTAGAARAASEKYTSLVNGTGFSLNQTSIVQDAQYPAMNAGVPSGWTFENVNSNGYVEIGIDHYSSVYVGPTQHVKTTVKITYEYYNYVSNSFTTATLNNVVLEVIYDEGSGKSTDKVSYKVPNASKMTVQILGFTDGNNTTIPAPANMYMKSTVEIERYHKFNHTYVPTGVSGIVNGGDLVISWDYIPGAEEYQLEYVFINAMTGEWVSNYPALYSPNNVAFTDDVFEFNSTRISTSQQFYKIPLIAEPVFIVWRVRGIGKGGPSAGNFSYDLFGKWSTDNGVTHNTIQDYVSGVHFTTVTTGGSGLAHEQLLNWQVTSTFAEEGKRKDVVSYYDGSLRNRQVTTKISTDNTIIAAQTIYDHQGRPAVSTLPAPVNTTQLGYVDDLVKNSATDNYNKQDFDLDAPSGCGTILNMMDPQYALVSKYYSEYNNVAQSHQEYIPSAEGYPFTVVQYEPDNTGRIHTQSGVGLNHNLNSGHSTQYFYGKPHQEQLDRLFGSEVGYAQHYKKNMVVDPNGQVSVSYLDMQGRVIATALAGDTLSNLRTLTKNDGTALGGYTNLSVDLLNKTGINDVDDDQDNNNRANGDKTLLYNGEELVATNNKTYNFEYTLTNTIFDDPCFVGSTTYPLVYDLDISVMTQCGIEMLNNGNGYHQTINSNYTNTPPSGTAVNVSLNQTNGLTATLGTGVYSITKNLSVNEDALNYFTNRYLSDLDPSCILTLEDFYNEALLEAQLSPCTLTCEACTTSVINALGTRAAYVAGGANQEEQTARGIQWDNLIADCMAPCTVKDICDLNYELLLQDVSPNGQYGEVTGDLSNSVFNENNLLVYINNDPHHWRVPSNGYRNADGTLAYIPLQDLGNGVYQPAIDNAANIEMIGGLPYVRPEHLANLSDFLGFWNSEWAKALVVYHPEYAYYQRCLQTRVINTNANIYFSSATYDQKLLETETWSAASATVINGSSSMNLTAVGALFANDPFFANGSDGYVFATAMQNDINNYATSGTTISMYTMASVTAKCGTWYGTNYTSCPTYSAYGVNATYRDEEWKQVRMLYLSLKQKYLFKAWDAYMVRNESSSSNTYYCGCIGDQGYNPLAPQHPQASFTTPKNNFGDVFMDNDQPCNTDHFDEYAYKARRFGNPDLSTMVANADALLYQQTGLCPNAMDILNFLNGMADDQTFTTSSYGLVNQTNFNDNLYTLITGNIPGNANYFQLTWNPTPSGSLLTASLTNTSACGTPVFTINAAPSLSWSNYGSSWKITEFVNFSPSSSSAFSVLAWVDHDNNINTPDVDYVFTGTVPTCVPLTGCSFAETCQTNSVAADLQVLINALSYHNQIGNTNVLLSGTANYGNLVSNHLASLFTGSLYWSKNANTGEYQITGGANTLKITFPAFITAGTYLNALQGNPSFNPPSNTIGGRVKINNATAWSNVTLQYFVGAGSSYLSAGGCSDNYAPSCNDLGNNNRGDLQAFLNSFFPTELTPTSTYTGYYSWSNNFQNQLASQSDDVFQGNGSMGSNYLDIPIVENSNLNNTLCVIHLETVPNQNGTPPNFSSITSISNLSPDLSQIAADGMYYAFTATANYSGGSFLVRGTSCFPIAQCNSCVPAPAPAVSCSQSYAAYQTAIDGKSLPEYFSISNADFCDAALQYCSEDYLDYLDGMAINDNTDPGYMSLENFCQSGYAPYVADYLLYINNAFSAHNYNTASFKWISLADFANGAYSKTCLEYYAGYLAGENPTLTLAEYCSGYAQDIPCLTNPATSIISWPVPETPEEDCNTYTQAVAMANATEAYQQYLNDLVNQFREAYIAACMKNAVENFRMSYPENEYHFTLYYYDQGGNLTRTVPPQGVNVITDPAVLTAIKQDRLNNTQTQTTQHAFTTTYTYNSLNQLREQKTPDAGKSTFWYDALGRIVVSQNAKQILNNDYSYSRYDWLGRVWEAGQANSGTAMTETLAKDSLALASWLGSASRTEITKTYYSAIYASVFAGIPIAQENVRNRIAHVAYFTTGANQSSNVYQSATHYSYDIHGNVKQLCQDIPALDALLSGQRFKRMNYSYDLVSGNVHQVDYQPGAVDYYAHRYVYDADNRITHVYTSTDNRHWDHDVRYYYYKHGVLARKETGHQIVQGEDYAYTIQGWIKGTNSTSLDATRDMGKDGNNIAANPHRYIANDIASYALHYFEGDYQSKGMLSGSLNASTNFLMSHSAATYLSTDAPNLYNGNIRYMNTTVRTDNASGNNPVAMLTAYRYDQLNRIKQMKMYRDANLSTNAWGNGASYSGAFEEHYVYDHNGNILQQKRNGNATTIAMDNLRYYYYKQDGTIFDPLVTATPSNATNKLAYVTDAIGTVNYTADIDNQSSGNYTYDAIGQLTSDAQEQIASIEWTVTGKVSKVSRTGGSNKEDLTFFYDAMGRRIAKFVKPQGSTNANDWKMTYYILDASGNQMAMYHRPEQSSNLILQDQQIYGSSREAVLNRNLVLNTATLPTTHYSHRLGDKQFQVSNHLGNVLSTFSDHLKKDNGGSGSTILTYKPIILSVSTYSSFGAPLEDGSTNWSNESYRYGFNGQEKDDEIKGSGNSYDFGARIYDTRLGRWMSCDPHGSNYPGHSLYSFVMNTPLIAIDPDGKDVFFVIYTGGSGDAYDAANTRISEIEKSSTFDPKKDKVVYLEVTDLGKLEEKVEAAVAEYSPKYGKTVEASFYGHAAADGPVGADETSKNSLADVTGNHDPLMGDKKQLSPKGWRDINFNFDPNKSIATFYGCNSDAFAQKFLMYQNVKYTAGTMGGAGGSYTFKGNFNATWLNIWGSNVYLVSEDGGEILPRYVYSRNSPTWTDDPGRDADGTPYPQRTSSTLIYGNLTVDKNGNATSGTEPSTAGNTAAKAAIKAAAKAATTTTGTKK